MQLLSPPQVASVRLISARLSSLSSVTYFFSFCGHLSLTFALLQRYEVVWIVVVCQGLLLIHILALLYFNFSIFSGVSFKDSQPCCSFQLLWPLQCILCPISITLPCFQHVVGLISYPLQSSVHFWLIKQKHTTKAFTLSYIHYQASLLISLKRIKFLTRNSLWTKTGNP